MRVLALIAAPNDVPPLDVAATWNALEQGLGPLRAEGRLILDRLIEPTEVTLKRKLAADPVDVLHFVGHGRAQEAAQYATLSVLAQDGRARKLTLQYVASLLRSHRARLAVLQIGGSGFVVSADIVAEGTLEAVIT